jgi:hypothetical protein
LPDADKMLFRRLPGIQGLVVTLGLIAAHVTGFSAAEADGIEAVDAAEVSDEDGDLRNRTLIIMGYLFGQQLGLNIGYTEEELDSVLLGIHLAAAGADLDEEATSLRDEAGKIYEQKRAFQNAMRKLEIEEADQKNREEDQRFFLELDKDESVMKSPTGLRYTIISEGSGNRPSPTDEINAEYTGTRINGEVSTLLKSAGNRLRFI